MLFNGLATMQFLFRGFKPKHFDDSDSSTKDVFTNRIGKLSDPGSTSNSLSTTRL